MALNRGDFLEHPALGGGFPNNAVYRLHPQKLRFLAAFKCVGDVGADDGLNAIGSEQFDQVLHVQGDQLRVLGVVIDDALGLQLQERAPEVCDHVSLWRLDGSDGVQLGDGQAHSFGEVFDLDAKQIPHRPIAAAHQLFQQHQTMFRQADLLDDGEGSRTNGRILRPVFPKL